MMAVLTLKHRNLHIWDMAPSRLQIPFIMSIARKLIGILTSTISALPIDFSFLVTDLMVDALFPP